MRGRALIQRLLPFFAPPGKRSRNMQGVCRCSEIRELATTTGPTDTRRYARHLGSQCANWPDDVPRSRTEWFPEAERSLSRRRVVGARSTLNLRRIYDLSHRPRRSGLRTEFANLRTGSGISAPVIVSLSFSFNSGTDAPMQTSPYALTRTLNSGTGPSIVGLADRAVVAPCCAEVHVNPRTSRWRPVPQSHQ